MPRILIADDRATMRSTLRQLLTLYGKLDVCGEAEGGRQAVDAAVALKPDLVMLDFKMPNGDGLMAAAEIKQKLPETQIVMFTLFKSGELLSRARQVGVRAVVAKEDGVVKLLHTIEEELGYPPPSEPPYRFISAQSMLLGTHASCVKINCSRNGPKAMG